MLDTVRCLLALNMICCLSLLGCAETGTDPDPANQPENNPPSGLTGAYFGQSPPGMTPSLFVPEELRSNDTWFWHGALAFTPDGNEFYLDIYYPALTASIQVRFMQLQEGSWTSVQPPSFVDDHSNASPSFTPDGNKVFFISDRPNGGPYRVWEASRNGTGWSNPTPVVLPITPNLGGGWGISVTRDETLYLWMHDTASDTDIDIYRTSLEDGVYTEIERLGNPINSAAMDISMFIDPDEDYIIFSSARAGGVGGTDLYISFSSADGSWTDAVNMGSPVNSTSNEGNPYVSPDGLYLFFNSERQAQYGRNPYWVDAGVIEVLRPGN